MEIDVADALRDLGMVANHIAAMFEWDTLAQQEHGSRALPPFFFGQKNRQELDDLYSQFLFLCMNIHMILEDPTLRCTSEQREAWRSRLSEIQEWVQCVSRSKGFINF